MVQENIGWSAEGAIAAAGGGSYYEMKSKLYRQTGEL